MWYDLSIRYRTHVYAIGSMYMWLKNGKQRENWKERARENENDSIICDMTDLHVIWLIYMWQDSCICDRIHVYEARGWDTTWEWERESEREWKLLIYMRHDWIICDMLHMNESRHTWMSHVTCQRVTSHMNESRHIYTSHVTCKWVMSHMNE